MRPLTPRILRRLGVATIAVAALGATAIAASASPVYHDTSYVVDPPLGPNPDGSQCIWSYNGDGSPNWGPCMYDPPPYTVYQGYYTYSPDNTSAPTISGQTRSTKTLTADRGSWTNDAANSDPTNHYTYQWQACAANGASCSSISGANATTYTLTADEIGKTLRVKVTASNQSGANSATSIATNVVMMNDTVAPTGTIVTGAAITAGAWLTSETATLPVNASDNGVGVYRAFWREDGDTTYASVDPDNAQCQPLDASQPYQFAAAVPCLTAAHDYAPSFDMAVLGDGTHEDVDLGIEDAAGNETILAANQTIKVNAPGLNPGPGNPGGLIDPGTPCTNGAYGDSGECFMRAPSSSSTPMLSGTPAIGGTLSTDQGAWNDVSDATYTYSWLLCDAAGGNCATIPGQNGASLSIISAMVDHTIRSVVTATTDGGSTDSTSAASYAIFGAGQGGSGGAGGITDLTARLTQGGGGGGGRIRLTDDEASSLPVPANSISIRVASNGNHPDGLTGEDIRITAQRGAATRALAYGQRAAITGRLTTASGDPISNAQVDVIVHDAVKGARGRIAGKVMTDRDGNFRYTPEAGTSRIFTFAYRLRLSDTSYARWSSVAVPVSARVTLAASSAKLRNGQTVTLTGRVTAAPTGSRKLVQLQAKVGRDWTTFASARLSNGTFTHRYRFMRTTGVARYAFRARVASSADWPMSTGVSVARTVKVTGPNGHRAPRKVKAGR